MCKSKNCSGTSSGSSCESDSSDEDCYYCPPSPKRDCYYTKVMKMVIPLQDDVSEYLYIHTPTNISKLRKTLKESALGSDIKYFVTRMDSEEKYNVLVKFKREINESEIDDIKTSFKNTDSYIYFPQSDIDSVIYYMEQNAKSGSSFCVDGVCNLQFGSIIETRRVAKNLIELNTRFGYETTPELISDVLAYEYIKIHGSKITDELVSRFGCRGVKLAKLISS